ncbi:MAG: hypothetical protein OXR72_07715 [Gemmatimonadota bacterium]|nr:hypothetical protein [Gemmatimonadota bacterium]
MSAPLTPAWAGSVPDSLEQALLNRKQALHLELRFVSENPDAYYLVIDLPSRNVYLKAGAHILRVCAIQHYRLAGALSLSSSQLRLIDRIEPHSVEPGNSGLRLRGRRLPIDFSGRLIEGPRGRSRLYFSPALLIQPHELPLPAGTFGIALVSSDVKALDSALRPGSAAILVPSVDFTP